MKRGVTIKPTNNIEYVYKPLYTCDLYYKYVIELEYYLGGVISASGIYYDISNTTLFTDALSKKHFIIVIQKLLTISSKAKLSCCIDDIYIMNEEAFFLYGDSSPKSLLIVVKQRLLPLVKKNHRKKMLKANELELLKYLEKINLD